ncbi:MAG: LEA type 2 family protein [Aestuariibaculum sp.]
MNYSKFLKFIILSIIIACSGCTLTEKPQFVNVKNVRVTKSEKNTITVMGDAIFLNPNDIGGNLKTDNIKIYVNDNEIAQVSTKSFDVPAKEEFSIPLTAIISKDSIFKGKGLGNLLGSLLTNNIKVQYKGDIVYKALGMSYTYNLDETESLKIK